MRGDGLSAAMLERIRRYRLLEADRQDAAATFPFRGIARPPLEPRPTEEAEDGGGMEEALLAPPCSPEDLDWAAEALGFPLPAAVQQLYLEIGNGGFGPANGFFGLERLVAEYQDAIEEASGPGGSTWPAMLLPIADLDPGFTCLDIGTGRVIDWAPEPEHEEEDWEGNFTEVAPDLMTWIEEWLGSRA